MPPPYDFPPIIESSLWLIFSGQVTTMFMMRFSFFLDVIGNHVESEYVMIWAGPLVLSSQSFGHATHSSWSKICSLCPTKMQGQPFGLNLCKFMDRVPTPLFYTHFYAVALCFIVLWTHSVGVLYMHLCLISFIHPLFLRWYEFVFHFTSLIQLGTPWNWEEIFREKQAHLIV